MLKTSIDKMSISDMKDRYAEIEKRVLKENKIIYLTEKGSDAMVILSMENYKKLIEDARYNNYVENALDEADRESENVNAKYYTHNEVIEGIRRKLNG